MSSDTLRLDGWNYALFFIETILNAAFVPVFFVFAYICATQKNLHVNFRSILFFTGVGCLVGAVHRLILVVARALIIILRINTLTYRKRHESMMQLADRYHFDENIRAGKYYIPVALNDFICKVIFVGLLAYSIFFTDIPLGHDTTHLSHAYDVMFAYQRMFFGLALTLRSEKFDNLMRRKKRAVRVIDSQAATNHFDGLRKLWS
ncbi:unnamed protein product [Haemonchus placei]|uniref:7TM_GPCR_Srx domain-containing protein n=1 Tax=Haemonchus placei TaxID=6290 RepID=A0A0N4W5U2_HAEPC|nr:unnamed protein product [Haemonchus placei]